jgi:hypothetical protein
MRHIYVYYISIQRPKFVGRSLKIFLNGLNLRFDVLTAVAMKSSLFWDIMAYSPLKVNWLFGWIKWTTLRYTRIREDRTLRLEDKFVSKLSGIPKLENIWELPFQLLTITYKMVEQKYISWDVSDSPSQRTQFIFLVAQHCSVSGSASTLSVQFTTNVYAALFRYLVSPCSCFLFSWLDIDTLCNSCALSE